MEHTTMRALLLVGGGGFLGSVARYLVFRALHSVTPAAGPLRAFPLGTLAVNVVGCLIIGALLAVGEREPGWSDSARLFLLTGILGGFTTFSAFGLDTFTLVRDGRPALAAANVLLQVGGGLAAVWAGYRVMTA
ncbi:MAG TPA: fluoride efflux transporter CrcB [Gemmatimonas sp.]|nr:fluoride efflux transporter CrcB [Gemmatimonas sp.]